VVLVAGEETDEILGTWLRAAAAEVVAHPAVAGRERDHTRHDGARDAGWNDGCGHAADGGSQSGVCSAQWGANPHGPSPGPFSHAFLLHFLSFFSLSLSLLYFILFFIRWMEISRVATGFVRVLFEC